MKTFKQIRKLEGIAATRIRLGMSQQAFAIELGISRSLLSRVENRQRTLPTATLVKLAVLEMALVTTDKTSGPGYSMPGKDIGGHSPLSTVNFTKTTCQLEVVTLQARLRHMMTRYAQAIQSLSHIDKLMAAAENEVGRFASVYLHVHRYNIRRKINKCNPAAQAALRYKIALLQAAVILEGETVKTVESGG
jgi:transcriptional regulator with XRE-family HTH domain